MATILKVKNIPSHLVRGSALLWARPYSGVRVATATLTLDAAKTNLAKNYSLNVSILKTYLLNFVRVSVALLSPWFTMKDPNFGKTPVGICSYIFER